MSEILIIFSVFFGFVIFPIIIFIWGVLKIIRAIETQNKLQKRILELNELFSKRHVEKPDVKLTTHKKQKTGEGA